MIYVADPDTYELLHVNKVFREVLGTDAIGKKCYRVIQDRETPCPFCTNDKIFGEYLDRVYIWEFQNERTGEWFRCADKAIPWPGGKLVRFEIAMNITEQKRLIQALSESEARYRTVVEDIPQKIFVKDRDCRWQSVNRRFAEDLGLEPEDVKGKVDSDFFPKELADKYHADDLRILESGETDAFDEEYIEDGVRRIVRTIKTPVRNEDDEIVGILGVFWDVTEERRMQNALRESEERFRLLAHTAKDMIYRMSLPDGAYEYVSPASKALFGYAPEEFYDNPMLLADAVHPDWQEYLREEWEKLLKGEITPTYEYQIIREDGEVRWMNQRNSMITGPDGRPRAIQGIVTDVTEEKAFTVELARLNRDLKRSNEELEQFAYVASHDLQEPLRMVSSYTQLLAKRIDDKLDEKTEKYINYAVDGANRMQILINDLLTFSRITTRGKDPVPVDSHSVLGKVIRDLSKLIEESSAIVTNDDLPEVCVDPSQFAIVLRNLIGNAIKFNESEHPHVHVSSSEYEDDMWLFEFKDNGIGIEREYSDRIFEIFQRLHSRREYSGTGIGLALCKRVIERHGGSIWIQSEPREGTTFFFTVPRP